MPLALSGFLIIVILLFLLLTKKTSVHIALVLPAIVIALISGFGISDISDFVGAGVSGIASVGIMLTFAILFFGIMFDAGMFEPIIKAVIKAVKGDPAKVALGTAVVAILTHLDGSGASTFLITVTAMLPIWTALKMNKVYLAACAGLGAGVMNVVPWGGPTLRASAALDVELIELFNPIAPVLILGIAWVLVSAYLLGKKERERLGIIDAKDLKIEQEKQDKQEVKDKGRGDKMFPVNIVLTILVIVALIMGLLPLPAIFIIATVLALLINYPVDKHQEKITDHSKGAIYTASVIFCAGVFTGILQGSGMIEAMSQTLVGGLPTAWGAAFPIVLGIFSSPLSLFFDPDSFYFGVLPVLAGAAGEFGIEAVQMGRAAILGQMSTGFPYSPLTGATWLLIGLAGVELGDLQKVLIPRAWMTTIIMVAAAVIMGLI